MNILIRNVELAELIRAARERAIRNLRVSDYARVESVEEGGTVSIRTIVYLVVTALDRKVPEIIRFIDRAPSAAMGNVVASPALGETADSRRPIKKSQVIDILTDEGFEVTEGEWTPKSAEAFLSARKALGLTSPPG